MSVSLRTIITKTVVDIGQSINGIYIPGDVINANITSAVKVGKGNLLRITVAPAAPMYIAFGNSTIAAVTSTTTPALRLPDQVEECVYHIIATDDYIRANIAATRIEVMNL